MNNSMQWIRCSDSMPDLTATSTIECIVCSDNGYVSYAMRCRKIYAKTEKGQRPRWEDKFGHIKDDGDVAYWMPFPSGPVEREFG